MGVFADFFICSPFRQRNSQQRFRKCWCNSIPSAQQSTARTAALPPWKSTRSRVFLLSLLLRHYPIPDLAFVFWEFHIGNHQKSHFITQEVESIHKRISDPILSASFSLAAFLVLLIFKNTRAFLLSNFTSSIMFFGSSYLVSWNPGGRPLEMCNWSCKVRLPIRLAPDIAWTKLETRAAQTGH